ncbi:MULTISPECIES: ABC transporter substrate-binding protein [Mesorhizobium]|uniref:ABC transporter substrate-binding protein n=4 Tax=Mesorhizobium TaxID=68287 RepID=A0ABZ0VJ81_9HYPH|nr:MULTISPECIES: ABC transporter substrate-binding protein [Mesorhizobium]MBZ9910418.1 ABC transporter substrate-binding protein [Mesorhizobium sp. BR115XR7A]QGX80642.1 ABC transporter substrate-binding protein [Mesorhizobium japonicum R7A]QJF04786.1 ABC transporter substrate-binding protein [Mesorhizobium japonicum R7A]QJF10855.1 ABC transporter substrate-binding protein [Mesorhizobium japonicum]QJI86728.1 ABC transporter substrate-binding protein [Mesorhizobium japonicum]
MTYNINPSRPTRRQTLKLIGTATSGAALAIGAPGILRAQESKLVVVSGGGSYEESIRKAIIDPFQQETGITVTYVSPEDDAKLKAQVDSNNVQWDVAEVDTFAFRPDASKYLEEIDYGVFDKETLDNLVPEAKTTYGVGSYVYSTVMAFSTTEYPANKPRPRSWAEFWDADKFPGPRSLKTCSNSDVTTIEFALLAAGVPKDKLYPIDFDSGFASLDRIKSHITKFWSVGAEPGQLLSNREVSMSSAYNGRMAALKTQGAAVDYQWNEGELSPVYWVVPRGAKNRAAAMRFVAYQASAQAQARLNNLIFYGPMNRAAFKYIDPKVAADLPTTPENIAKQFFRDLSYWETKDLSGKSNTEILVERWIKWTAS